MEISKCFPNDFENLLLISDSFSIAERQDHQKGTHFWGIWNSNLSRYSLDFFPSILKSTTLRRMFLDRSDRTGQCSVLEICGSGECLADNSITHGIAITLNDFRSESQSKEDLSKNRLVIESNLLQDPWSRVSENMNSIGIKSFDFMLMAPWGGWSSLLPKDKDLKIYFLYHYIQNAWKFLSPENGQFFIKLPTGPASIDNLKLLRWLTILETDYGVESDFPLGSNELRLTRKADSSEKLIEPNILEEKLFRERINIF